MIACELDGGVCCVLCAPALDEKVTRAILPRTFCCPGTMGSAGRLLDVTDQLMDAASAGMIMSGVAVSDGPPTSGFVVLVTEKELKQHTEWRGGGTTTLQVLELC